jgi:hypothetical protein
MARTVLEILQPLDADQSQVQEECQNQLKDGEGWPQHCSRILLRAKYKSKYKHPTDLYTDLRHQENFISWQWQVHCACIMLAFFC